MLTRDTYLRPRVEPASSETTQLEADGYVVIHGALTVAEIDALRTDIDRLFAEPDTEHHRADDGDEYRYAALNQSALVQADRIGADRGSRRQPSLGPSSARRQLQGRKPDVRRPARRATGRRHW